MMKLKALLAGGLLAMSATASMAQSLDPVRVEMFRSILAGNECTLTEAAAGNILPRFDFTREETRAIVGALVAAGEVQLDGNTLMLVDGSCATEDPVADLLARNDVQQFIAVMSEYNCTMSEADAGRIFPERGMDKDQVRAVVVPMIGANMATFNAGILNVDSAYCSPALVAEETAPVVAAPVEAPAETVELDRSGMFGMSRVRQLVDVMAANSCTLNMETPDAFLQAAGIEHSFATFVARKMIADGYASMVDDQNMLLPAPYCVSANSPAPVEAASSGATGVDMDMVASLREIFLANSCRLTEDQMDAQLPPAGFTRDNIKPIFGFLKAGGEMGEDGPDLVFYSDACPAAPAEVASAPVEMPAAEMDRSGMFGLSRVGELVDVMAQNGCTLNMEVADGYLAEAGIEHSFATFIAKKMISDGYASMVDGQNMVLPAPYCIAAGSAAPVVAQAPEADEAGSDEPGVDMAMVATMRRIFSENGCRLGNEQMDVLLPPAGFTHDNVRPVFDFLEASGEMTKQDGVLILTGDTCAAAPAEAPVAAAPAFENDGSPRARFMAAVIANGCALEVSGAEDYLANTAGLRMDQAFRIVDDMVAEGEATLMLSGTTVQLEPALCAGTGTAQVVEQADPVEAPDDTATVPTLNGDDPRAGVLAMLAANNCEVTQANVAGLAEAAGLELNTTMQILGAMMNAGEATSPDFGQTLQVGAPLCVATAAEPMTPRDIFINLIKQNDCSITAAEFSQLLPVDGLDASTAFGMIGELEAEGVISLPATRDVVTLSAEMCR